MEIFDLKTMQKIDIEEKTIVALGTFDGCHYAHQRVLGEAFYMAKAKGVKSLVYTFYESPKTSFGTSLGSVFTFEEKIKAFQKTGIDYLAVDSFFDVKEMSANDFFQNVLIDKLNAVGATCGYNYKFGKQRMGDGQLLSTLFSEKVGGSVKICDKIEINNQVVSSTLLRSLVQNGEVEQLYNLGTRYSIYSMVESGKKLGRTIGFPTINQKIPQDKVIPRKGVYITECEIGEDVYPAISNVGVRPSVESSCEINVETHIIGYDGMLYGSYVRVNFYKFLREEQRFNNLDELKVQISCDTEEAKKYFK